MTGRLHLRMRLIEVAETPDADELITVIRERTRRTDSYLSRDRILAHKDEDRR